MLFFFFLPKRGRTKFRPLCEAQGTRKSRPAAVPRRRSCCCCCCCSCHCSCCCCDDCLSPRQLYSAKRPNYAVAGGNLLPSLAVILSFRCWFWAKFWRAVGELWSGLARVAGWAGGGWAGPRGRPAGLAGPAWPGARGRRPDRWRRPTPGQPSAPGRSTWR